MKTHGETFLRYLDGSLSEKEVQQLNTLLLDDAGLRHEFSRLLLQQVHLFDFAQSQKGVASHRGFQGLSGAKNSNPNRKIVRFPSSPSYLIGAAAVIAILLSVFVLSISTMPHLETFVGTDVKVQRGRQLIMAARGLTLRAGDLLITGRTNKVVLTYSREDTRLSIDGESSILVLPSRWGKEFKILHGRVNAVVSHQPKGKPMIWLSPSAKATVVGTEFRLAASTNTARLDVLEGTVAFEALGTGKLLNVRKSQSAEVAPGVAFELQTLSHGYGSVLRETWLDIENVHVRDLTQSPRYPDNPNFRDFPPTFSVLTNWPGNSGVRLRAWLRVPRTGRYHFWITGGDAAELRLSENELDESGELISSLSQSAAGQWDRFPWQKSPPLHLVAGRKYFLEALFKKKLPGAEERAGVAWQAPGGKHELIPSQFLLAPAISNEKGNR